VEKRLKIEKMRYQENKISYNLAMAAFLINLYYLIVSLNSLAISFHIGIEIGVNLLIFMFFFLGMEKVKSHDLRWSQYFIGLGFVFFLRVLYMPRMLMAQGNELINTGDAIDIATGEAIINASYKSAGSLIVIGILIIISGIIGYQKARALRIYFENCDKK